MSWFWGKKDAEDKTNDPYSKLDPSLREFLDKESPLKYEDTHPKPQTQPSRPSPNAPSTQYSSRLGLETSTPDPNNPSSAPSPVPSESLFPDGRYAHLWKTYRPQSEIDAASKSDADRLADVVAAYNDRKSTIGRTAIANCVELQIAEKECLTHGPWSKRMTMCREENRAFHRCFNMQSRFLKALGYLAMDRDPEEDERIQMHADKLYHEMLAREKARDEARAAEAVGEKEGQEAGKREEAPPLALLIKAEETVAALGPDSAWARARRRAAEKGISTNLSDYAPERQEEIRKRIKGMSREEQDLELQLIAAETRAQLEYAEKIEEQMEQERKHRADRRHRGKETVGDTIKRLWGWDQ